MSFLGHIISAINTARFVAWELLLVAARSLLTMNRGLRIALAAVTAVAGIVGATSFLLRDRPDAWRGEPPTPEQIRYAGELGVSVADGVTKGELAEQIVRAKESRRDTD